ncbi:MAG: DNA-directed RNA polymerase subunit omega [Lentimicrobiaceae bacterium]|nr:DNA-directed RNA polymerase subunit omega [Lentimicrobiaceae bacterium]
MEYKKLKIDLLAVTRNMEQLNAPTGNIYETVNILSKRANQISKEIKEELGSKILEFSTPSDNLEEVFENREQIEIAKYYEHIPKASLVSTYEFLNNELYFRNPAKEIAPDQF